MKNYLIKLFTSFIPLLLLQSVRYSLLSLRSRFVPVASSPSRAEVDQKEASTDLCFLLGSPRSGTTLTSVLLDGASQASCPPELYLATYHTLRQRHQCLGKSFFKAMSLGLAQCLSRQTGKPLHHALREIRQMRAQDFSIADTYQHLLNNTSARVFIDKTPCYVAYISPQLFSERFPQARYIYLHRHPVPVIVSQKKWLDGVSDKQVANFARKGIEASEKRSTNYFTMLLANPESHWQFEDFKAQVYPEVNFDKFKMLEAGWRYENQRTLDFLDTIAADHKLIVSFESLIKDPSATLGRMLEFLNVSDDPAAIVADYENKQPVKTVIDVLKRAWQFEIGDPNQLFMTGKIDASRADSWQRQGDLWLKLDEETRQLARRLGYPDPISSPGAEQDRSSADSADNYTASKSLAR